MAQDHPLRAVRKLTDQVLGSLSGEFDQLYAATDRRSIAPEYILRVLLLQVFYSIRSGRQLVEQIDYNLLFRWFVGLGMDDAVWHHAVFSKNRDRLLSSAVAQQFFSEVNRQAKRLMSDEHFTVDGTLIQAWASQKSFRSKDGSSTRELGIISRCFISHVKPIKCMMFLSSFGRVTNVPRPFRLNA